MAAPGEDNNFRRHLEITEEREIVYCHQCGRQWYQDQHGVVCPVCEGDIIEIVSEDSDPRPPPPIQRPPTPPDFHSLRGHNPWGGPAGDSDSDPDEADIEEHITHGPGHSLIFTRTVHSSTPLRGRNHRIAASPDGDPDHVMTDFQSMISNLMGPQFRPGQAGRSGPGNLFSEDGSPHVTGARWTFTTTGGRVGPRDADGPQPGPQVDDIANLLGGLFNPMGPHGGPPQPGLPPGLANLQGLFAAMLNPANARSGDAVYTQEALDNIISQLMEQHPTSNAPGPAPEAAIASLPKKRLDEVMLGSEGKGECSVCMDDVTIGDEVVALPCSHWFHEQCARIWLKEHNTCPICRKGIDGDSTGSGSNQAQGSSQNSPRRHSSGGRLNGFNRPTTTTSFPRVESFQVRSSERAERNSQRLQAIRDAGGRTQNQIDNPPFISRVVSDGHRHATPNYFGSPPDAPSAREGRSVRRASRQESYRSERSREETRNSERSRQMSRRDSQQTPLPPRRTSSAQTVDANGGGVVGSALGWLRDRLIGGSGGAAGGGSNSRH